MKKIELVLERLAQKEPVLFSYDSDILTNSMLTNFGPTLSGNHSSVIVGNRVRDNRCEILVQNSWGQLL